MAFTEDVVINGAKGNANDVSEGGMFVCTDRDFKEGSIIDIEIPVKFTVKAAVKHRQEGVGIGVQFIDLDDKQKMLIGHLVESLSLEARAVRRERKRILIIEDSKLNRKLYKTRLTADGFSVLEARDGIEGIAMLSENTPDAIVLDLYMEKMDGLKVLTVLKSSAKWAYIPVLVFSALITQDVINRLIEAGADDFLVKQVTSPSELSEAVKALLERVNR